MHRTATPARGVYCFLVLFLVLAPAILPKQAHGAVRWLTPKKRMMKVRLLMQLPQAATTTAGRNFNVFVAEQELPHGLHLVRLSYEYLYYEPPITQILDSRLTYRIRAYRDAACDESLATVGRQLGLDQAKVEQALGVKGSKVTLACYRTTPRDYVSVRRGKE